MNIQTQMQGLLNGVAETQYFLKHHLEEGLKQRLIYPDGKKHLGNYDNYYDYWVQTRSERFFDMTTFIRLGSAVEGNLKRFYMDKIGHKNLLELHADPNYKQNIFQRVQGYQANNAIALYSSALGIDLTAIPQFVKMQELMMHRHLYAHNSGLIDDGYLNKIKIITGIDLQIAFPEINSTYPQEDTYWFDPLVRLPEFIEDARRFFSQLA